MILTGIKSKEHLAKTFRIINATLSDNSFKRNENGIYKGGFQLTIFEVLATGVYLYLKEGLDEVILPGKIRAISQNLSSDETFSRYSGSGSKANYRWPKFVPLAKRLFLDNDED